MQEEYTSIHSVEGIYIYIYIMQTICSLVLSLLFPRAQPVFNIKVTAHYALSVRAGIGRFNRTEFFIACHCASTGASESRTC